MDIKLYSFEEALQKLKNKEMPMLIRAKYMEADFANKCILLYRTDKYVAFSNSCISGVPDVLMQTTIGEDGYRTASYAQIESKDILACDYIDSSEWELFDTKDEYDEKFRR